MPLKDSGDHFRFLSSVIWPAAYSLYRFLLMLNIENTRSKQARYQGLVPVILASWETEIWRIMVQG
jgi:hypothetical protein